jgi:anthranilate synthase/aminodeoxychorismate synthase-like glutamine amidotransferase
VRVLLVDNYDSFAWNLVQALRTLGAEVLVRRNDAVTTTEAMELAPDAIVVSPGPKAPRDAGVSVPLVRAAAARGVPLLGVCLGHQAIGEAFGAPTVRAPQPVHGKTSLVAHDAGPEFRGAPSPFEAMRYHSLGVAAPLPQELVRTAWTADAAQELMAVRHRTLPIVGFQFHPESYLTPEGPRLLGNFLEAAAAHGAAAEAP